LIFAQPKPVDEIMQMIAPYKRVLIAGCGTCVTVCGAGGEREVALLHTALRAAEARNGGEAHAFQERTVRRQCDSEFLEALDDRVRDVDAVVALGCGVGVGTMSDRYSGVPIMPGVNTSFMGAPTEWGVWDERCSGCGDCRLGETGGICPISRCTKGMLNGPCGGTEDGKCEANAEMDCAWILIYRRLDELGQLDNMRRYNPPRNFRTIPRPRRVVTRVPVEVGSDDG
jgi:ferredoxin